MEHIFGIFFTQHFLLEFFGGLLENLNHIPLCKTGQQQPDFFKWQIPLTPCTASWVRNFETAWWENFLLTPPLCCVIKLIPPRDAPAHFSHSSMAIFNDSRHIPGKMVPHLRQIQPPFLEEGRVGRDYFLFSSSLECGKWVRKHFFRSLLQHPRASPAWL